MKHVFTVHSPITFLAAHAVIEHLGLPAECIVIIATKYKVPINKYSVFTAFNNLKSTFFQKLLTLNGPVNEDRYIEKITEGAKFIAYIDLMSFNQATLVTHKNCSGFHFIEEGNSSYRKGDTFETVTWSWYRKSYPLRIQGFKNRVINIFDSIRWGVRGYSQRLLAMPYSFTSYAFFEGTSFFCFSELAYPDISPSKKEVTLLSSTTSHISELAGGVSLSNTCIWVDGSNRSFTGLVEGVYHRAIDKAISLHLKVLQEKGVHLKLRPGTKDYSDNYLYKALLKNSVKVQVLPDNLIVEAVFVNSQNCQVIGNLSSALFYAAIFGHQAYSIYHLYETTVKTIFDEMPGYWAMVKRL